ncbi:MAG: Ig-like domain repeat protein [Acidobacteriota bacterium]|nr:Ig-like domain repeat protein [Acidobacteriota bacterium]
MFLSAQQTVAIPSAPRLVTQSVDEVARMTLRGNVHPLARPEFDQGEAPADLPLGRMLLVLNRSTEQEAALSRLIEDQQDIHSPNYHRWLTPQQFGERFGPAPSDIESVTQWLSSNGFQVAQVSKSRIFIEFSGNAQAVRQAFGTPIHGYIVNGQQHWANATEPTVPSALAPVVAGINSLHNFQKQAQNVPLGSYSVASRRRASPAYTFGGGTNQVSDYAIVPYDFAAIYDLLPLWNATPTPINGTGQIIAIVGRSDINPADAPALWNYFGLDGTHAPQPKLVVTYNGPNPGKTADEDEADIDTQWSGAVAPGATIDYVVSASTATTDGIDLSALYIVDNNLAPVLSESYGTCEASMGATGVQFYGSLWEQAAAQGISVFVSSGDSGAAGCDDPAAPAHSGLQVNGIASTPFNAAVGGTDFNQYQAWSTYWNPTNNAVTKQSAKGYIPETTWNDSCTNAILQSFTGGSANPETNCNNSTFASVLNSTGGGGGQSSTWLKPTWQTGTPNDNARDLPDVSLFASNGFLNSYYLVCQSDIYPSGGACNFGSFQGFGGTSISSPQFAGIMALVNQKTGSPQGIPGLTLYKLAAQQPSAFHDVPAGSTIAMPCLSGTPKCSTSTSGDKYGVLSGYSTTTGFDLATGLGSVDVANLVNSWQSVSFASSATTLAMNGGAAINIAHGAAVSFNISVTPATATGDAALMVAPGTPGNPGIAAYPLTSGTVAASTALLPGGSYKVLAHYGGDSNYGGSYSNSVAVTVSLETSSVFVNLITTSIAGTPTSYSSSSATYGSGYQYLRMDVGDTHASLSPSSGMSSLCSSRKESCPTGRVVLSAPGTSLDGAVLQLNAKGFAQIPAPPPGTYAVTTTYQGDASFGTSVATTSFTIAKASTTLTAAISGQSVQYGNQEQLVAGIVTTSDGVAPKGTFQFYIDGVPLSGPQSVYESSGFLGLANGVYHYATADATLLTNFLALGGHTISVQYSGDANYAASTSPATAFTVTQAIPTFSSLGVLNVGGGPVVAGQSATATATIFGVAPGTAPTGTVTIYVNNVAVSGTATYNNVNSPPTLTASIPALFSTPGTYSISATYSGDAHYASATYPVPYTLTVLGPITVTKGAGIVVASPGLGGSASLSITPNGGFSGTATVTCTPDPAAKETGCTLTNGSTSGSSLQVNVGGTGASMTVNVTTTAPHQVAQQSAPHIGQPSQIVLAGLFVLFLPAIKRRRATLHCLLGLCLALGLGACGGSISSGSGGSGNIDPGTALGQYSFTITATTGSGTSQFTTTTQVPVLVN